MSRSIGIEFPNAQYHVTSRGDRREVIFEDADDRRNFLQTLGQVVVQFNWLCYAWCLMHSSLVLLCFVLNQRGQRDTGESGNGGWGVPADCAKDV